MPSGRRCRSGFVRSRCRGNQSNARNFRGDTETIRRAPVSRAAAHIYPQILQSIQTAGEGLEKTHEVIPWPELAPMGVPRNSYIEAGAGGADRRIRLVSEQDFRSGIGR